MLQHKQQTDREQKLSVLGRTLQVLREGDSVRELVETTLDYLDRECCLDLVWVGLSDGSTRRLRGQGGYSTKGDNRFCTGQFDLTPGDPMDQAIVAQKPLAIAAWQEESCGGEWSQIALAHNIQGSVIFPLRYRDTCLGVVWLGSAQWGMTLSSEEKSRLSIVLGQLAATLGERQRERQQQQTIGPHKPLLKILSQLQSPSDLDRCLSVAVEETQRFLNPSRTHIYWCDRERYVFWSRASSASAMSHSSHGKSSTIEISMHELGGFERTLLDDGIVTVGESRSSLKADATNRLTQHLEARSLLAAPIIDEGELLGFVSVEGKLPRIWQEEEKQFLQGVVQLLALAFPLTQIVQKLERVELDRHLTAGLARTIATEEDWTRVLEECAALLGRRMNVDRTLVLYYNSELSQFEIIYQSYPPTAKPMDTLLPVLSYVDYQLLEASRETIAIEDWHHGEESGNLSPYARADVRLSAWQDVFTATGARSLLLCSTNPGSPLEGVLVVTGSTPRAWNAGEKELFRSVSGQIGSLVHQWQIQSHFDHQQQMLQTFQWGLTSLLQIERVEELEPLALEQIAGVLQVPLVALVAWPAGQRQGRVVRAVTSNSAWQLPRDVKIAIDRDPLIGQAIATQGAIGPIDVEDLAPATRQWLGASQMKEVRAMALHTAAEHQPTAVLILADRLARQWSDREIDLLDAIVSQLARSRRMALLSEKLNLKRENLEALNWHKNRRMEEFYWAVGTGIKQLSQFEQILAGSANPGQSLQPERYHQTLHQLSQTLGSLGQFLKKERWQMTMVPETFSIAGFLNRAMERVEPARKQRQLWLKVNRQGHFSIQADRPKLEPIFYELLLWACQRSPQGGQIDIWYRPIEGEQTVGGYPLLELSISDSGQVDPRLFQAYETGRSLDLLAPSLLDRPPGLHLLVYDRIMGQMGGSFHFYTVEDGRVVSQLLIPIARGSHSAEDRPN